MSNTVLMLKATAAATGGVVDEGSNDLTVQATVNGTGAVSAVVVIEGSNDQRGWIGLVVLTAQGTTTASDGAPLHSAWKYTRARCTSISGTGAEVTVTMGV